MRTFHLLVANTLVASVTNNFLWFALTFWVYLETRSVLATAIIGGGYMLLVAVSAHVLRDVRRPAPAPDVDAPVERALARGLHPGRGRSSWSRPARRCATSATPPSGRSSSLVLAGAIAGNLRSVALSTTVTLLVPEEGRDRANGLVGTANGVAFALTSVFSGLAIGLLGMGACIAHRRRRHRPRRASTS